MLPRWIYKKSGSKLSRKVSDLKSHTINGESPQKQGLQDVGPLSMMDKFDRMSDMNV